MFTLINALLALLGLGLGVWIGTWYEKKARYTPVGPSTTYTPDGVILLDGATGKKENIVEESQFSALESARNEHVERIGKLFEEGMKKWEEKGRHDTF